MQAKTMRRETLQWRRSARMAERGAFSSPNLTLKQSPLSVAAGKHLPVPFRCHFQNLIITRPTALETSGEILHMPEDPFQRVCSLCVLVTAIS